MGHSRSSLPEMTHISTLKKTLRFKFW